MESVKVLIKGQIVIPASLRKKYAIKPGHKLQVFEYGRLIYLAPRSEDPIGEAMECLPSQPSLASELLEERRRDRNG
jgi:AbrB family looped-hinge helix DNA binding protein